MEKNKGGHPIENYLRQLQEIYSTGGGTGEESYYGALEALVNGIGGKLKPKGRWALQLKDIGAEEADFGLFAEKQFQRVIEINHKLL